MKVYWDGLGLNGSASGVYSHALSLAKAMNSFGVKPMVIPHAPLQSDLRHYLNLSYVQASFFSHFIPEKLFSASFAEQEILRRESNEKYPVIFHGLSNINLGIFNKKNNKLKYVITIHDLIPLLQPKGTSVSLYLHYKYLLPAVLRRADLIIAVSDWTKTKLMENYPWIDSHKIVVIPNGRPDSIQSLKSSKYANSKMEAMLLCVSRGESYKRLGFLIEIFRCLKLRNPSLKLTLVTDLKGRKLVQQNSYHELGINCLVNVEPKILEDLYEKTSMLIQPSLMEGYGLPIIEAIAKGTKVIFTKGSAMDSFYTDSYTRSLDISASAEEWAENIENFLVEQPNEVAIAESKRYYESLPTWNQVAAQLYNEYQKLIS